MPSTVQPCSAAISATSPSVGGGRRGSGGGGISTHTCESCSTSQIPLKHGNMYHLVGTIHNLDDDWREGGREGQGERERENFSVIANQRLGCSNTTSGWHTRSHFFTASLNPLTPSTISRFSARVLYGKTRFKYPEYKTQARLTQNCTKLHDSSNVWSCDIFSMSSLVCWSINREQITAMSHHVTI